MCVFSVKPIFIITSKNNTVVANCKC